MTTYEVPVALDLLPEVLDPENPGRPETWRSVVLVDDRPYGDRDVRLIRVEDDSAPPWTAAKQIEPTLTCEYGMRGTILRTWVSEYREVQRRMTVPTIADAVRESRENPGAIVTVDESGEQ